MTSLPFFSFLYFNRCEVSHYHFTFYFLLPCESESIFICMLAFQKFLLWIISLCPRESFMSTLHTNQTILSPLLWRVTFTMCQSHILSVIYFWGLYSVPHLFYVSLCILVHIVCITMAFSYISILCIATFPAPIFPLLFLNCLRSWWPFFLFIPSDNLLVQYPNTIYWKH